MSSPPSRSSRRRAAVVALCAGAVIALAGAPAAMSATLNANPALSELSGPSETATQTTAAKTTGGSESTSSSKSAPVVIIVLAAALVLIGGIVFVIMRDARRVAPATDALLTEGSSPRHSPERLRRRRAKAKAARQQRKRNR